MIRKEVLGFLSTYLAIWVIFIAHASTVGGRIYVIGGEHAQPNPVPTGAVDVYDPATDKWTHAADMPTARGFFATAVVDGRIFAIGGSPNMLPHDPGIGTVEIYDPKTNH